MSVDFTSTADACGSRGTSGVNPRVSVFFVDMNLCRVVGMLLLAAGNIAHSSKSVFDFASSSN